MARLSKQIAVIGSGFGGLATAVRLQKGDEPEAEQREAA